ncbi:PAS domain-containing sensor histidine kinase [Methanolobus bombayensis]|uniref:PAS domain-containing sensor histidine kinase n=1 Tax=Methanolobus bombayensis TaxID=38023 RepID=UPI001AE805B9|nr:PAS domain-containing sensor histidine kinase [Methanolobus bombayensis]MBP1909495.1 PAS domain S-box-containing protein [Methanolobus bombayensis]
MDSSETCKDEYMENLRLQAYDRLHELEKEDKIRDELDEKLKSVLHELQVHQIELELQNEELRKAQAELVVQRESYYHLFHRAPVGYALLDENGIIRKANELLCQIIDCHKCDDMHEPLSKYILEEDRVIYMSRFKAFFKKPEGKTLEVRIKDANGNILHMEMRGRKEIREYFSFPGNHERASMILITFNDVTERKKAEQATLKAMLAAEEANNIKSRFLANMSHELRTPLTSIIGFSEALVGGEAGELNDDQKHYLTYIEEGGNHLLNLINDLLDISKTEAGKMELSLEQIKLNDIFEEIEHMIYPIASCKNINLNFVLEPDDIIFDADPGKIKQILINLISNAIKFTPEEGTVEVSGRSLDQVIEISVEDTGIGIPYDYQKKIFEPFSQINSASNTEQKGTGLGLALVKKLVELHNGTIQLESEVSKGSKFSVTIPKTFNLFDVSK